MTDTPTSPAAPGSVWISLGASEVVELKRIAMDRDGDDAVAFFRQEVLPRVRAAAVKHGIALDLLSEEGNR